jgi:replicative DNA helicase
MRENVDDILKLVEFNKSSDGLLTGIDTGFKDLNRITNGLQGGDLIIVAAETSQGKTSFALNMAQKAGVENDVYLISCEMQAKQITSRMLSYDSEISSNHIQTGKLGNDETERLYHFAESVAANKLLINGNDNDIDKIIASIRVFHATKNIKMVVIDYLQLIATEDRGSKEQQTAKITRRLKNLAKEIDIPIILLSQLSRDKQNPFPRLSRLRDSGQIEEAADIVIFIWRPEMYNIEYFDFDNSPTAGRAEIIVAKGRNSGTGVFHTTFHKHLTKFSDEF